MKDSTPLLCAQNLHRYLGEVEERVHVLRGISLQLFPYQTYSMVGPSGCGKSTLLYLLGLLDKQDIGEIWIGSRRLSKATERERSHIRSKHIGFVFQFHFLLSEFTAVENVLLPMQKRGHLTPSQQKERAYSLLKEVGLEAKSHRLVTQLSGGEKQRVAIARALANAPSILLADEPTGNLDVKNSNRVFELLQSICHKRGVALLMATHNLELATRTDCLLKMQDGIFY